VRETSPLQHVSWRRDLFGEHEPERLILQQFNYVRVTPSDSIIGRSLAPLALQMLICLSF
jgi:hypothetical protein